MNASWSFAVYSHPVGCARCNRSMLLCTICDAERAMERAKTAMLMRLIAFTGREASMITLGEREREKSRTIVRNDQLVGLRNADCQNNVQTEN